MNQMLLVKKCCYFLCGFIVIVLLSQCNKPVSYYDGLKADSTKLDLPVKKVLIINIDGGSGNIIKATDLPNIKGLLSHSIYSWDALADSVTTDQASWAGMVTGVRGKKNGVDGATYKDNHFAAYPSFFSRAGAANSNLNIGNITSVAALNDTLLPKEVFSFKVNVNNDLAVKDSTLRRLANDNPDLLMVSFSGVSKAGIANGFSQAVPAYIDALKTTDGYIGEIITALKARKNYGKEDWLIVISSNHGGTATGSYGGSSYAERNTFVIYNHASFVKKELKAPFVNVDYTGRFPYFERKDGYDHAAYSNSSMYLFGADVSFTVEFNILSPLGAQRDNPVITNKNWNSGGNRGWLVLLNQKNIRVNYTGNSGTRLDINSGPMVADGKWHHITVVFNRQKEIAIYDNGEFFIASGSIKDKGNIDPGLPLTLGTHAILNYDYYGNNDGSLRSYIADVRIWKAILTPEVIREWSFQPVTTEHPEYANLLGNWMVRNDETNPAKLIDSSPLKQDLTILNAFTWNPLSQVLNASPLNTADFVPQSIDISTNVLSWLGVKIKPAWDTDGKIYILQ